MLFVYQKNDRFFKAKNWIFFPDTRDLKTNQFFYKILRPVSKMYVFK